MQNHRNHRSLQACRPLDRQINRARLFHLDPIADAIKCALGGDGGAYAHSQRVKRRVTVGALHDRLYLGAVLEW